RFVQREGTPGRIVVDVAGGGLRREPLADVPLVGLRARRQLGRREAAGPGERLVEPEPVADADERRAGGSTEGAEQLAEEFVDGGSWHARDPAPPRARCRYPRPPLRRRPARARRRRSRAARGNAPGSGGAGAGSGWSSPTPGTAPGVRRARGVRLRSSRR